MFKHIKLLFQQTEPRRPIRGRKNEEIKMYETVKTVNGYEIKRMKGTHGAYHVNVREGKGWREYHTFRTIKAAAAFCETLR